MRLPPGSCPWSFVGDFLARLSAASCLGGAEAVRRALARLRRLDLAIARRSGGHEGVEQFVRRLRHLVHRAVESGLVCLGRSRESAQLADELQGGRADFFIRGGGFEVVRRRIVSTHPLPATPRVAGAAKRAAAEAPARIPPAPKPSRHRAGSGTATIAIS